MTTKETLLYLLEKNIGKEISGEGLARALGVSRVAVWKAVSSLLKEGFAIDSLRSKGYRMSADCDKLSDARISAHLPEDLADMPVFAYDVIDSTDLAAKRLAGGDFSGRALFAANEQTAGRGRLGRSFYSPAGNGLYLSFLFSSSAPLEELGAVTPYAAVAVAGAIESACGTTGIGIKWVNDLLIDGKKICGISAEAMTPMNDGGENRIILGVGINLRSDGFPEELKEIAGALGCTVNRCALAAGIATRLARFADDPRDRSFMAEYTARSVVIGKRVRLNKWGDTVEGTVRGFDENGGLLLDVGEKEPRLFTGGEISLRFC